jgi:hypothetical protein
MPVDGTLGCLRSFARLREQHEHLKLILSIGGGAASKNFSAVAASATKRESFALSSKSLIEAHGFQGIDSTSPYLFLRLDLTFNSRLGTPIGSRAGPELPRSSCYCQKTPSR